MTAVEYASMDPITVTDRIDNGGLYWTRTSDLSHVKGTRYQLRQQTLSDDQKRNVEWHQGQVPKQS